MKYGIVLLLVVSILLVAIIQMDDTKSESNSGNESAVSKIVKISPKSKPQSYTQVREQVNGKSVVNTYDSENRKIKSIDSQGNITVYTYNQNGELLDKVNVNRK